MRFIRWGDVCVDRNPRFRDWMEVRFYFFSGCIFDYICTCRPWSLHCIVQNSWKPTIPWVFLSGFFGRDWFFCATEGSTNSIPHLLFLPCNVMEQRRWQVGVSFVCTRVCLQHTSFGCSEDCRFNCRDAWAFLLFEHGGRSCRFQ